jgi:Protein of unknown function (DUF3632)
MEDASEDHYAAVFSDYLGATDQSALAVAADRFADPIERAFLRPAPDGEPHVESLLWDAWQYLIDVAATADETIRAKMVDLVLALQHRGVLTREPDGLRCLVWGQRVWDELPLFGPQMREALNGVSDETFRHVNAFAAQATAAAVACGAADAVDFTLWAMWAFRDCVESTPEHLREMGLHSNIEERLLVVVVWLKYGGPILAALAGEHPEDDGQMFSIPRWTRWRTRLGAIAGENEPAAGIAREALSLMPSLL